jgi:hypothetical protein
LDLVRGTRTCGGFEVVYPKPGLVIVIGVVNVPPTPTAIVAVAVDPTDTITPSSFISITLGGEEIFATTEFPVYPLPELLITND